MRKFVGLKLAVIAMVGWHLGVAAQEGTDSPLVHRYKEYLSNPPGGQSITFYRKVSNLVGVGPGNGATDRKLLHGRWDNNKMHYIQSLRSLEDLDAMHPLNALYSGRSNEMFWHLVGNHLTMQFAANPDWKELPPSDRGIASFDGMLNEALGLGIGHGILPGTVKWQGDDFRAECIDGGLLGHLQTENGRPKTLNYTGFGRGFPKGLRLRVQYEYPDNPGPDSLPSALKRYRRDSGKEILSLEVEFVKREVAAENQLAAQYSPFRFMIPRWDSLTIYSNKTYYYHPEGSPNRLVPMRPMNSVGMIAPRNYRLTYLAVAGVLLLLPVVWLVWKKMRRLPASV